MKKKTIIIISIVVVVILGLIIRGRIVNAPVKTIITFERPDNYKEIIDNSVEPSTILTINTEQNVPMDSITSKSITENIIEPAPTETKPTTTTEPAPNKTPDYVLGIWTGIFGKEQLTINIESIDANGSVIGYNEVKGNKRGLAGQRTGNSFVLKEPGDDQWDGVFTFVYEPNSNSLIGDWKANNGKLTRNYKLNRK